MALVRSQAPAYQHPPAFDAEIALTLKNWTIEIIQIYVHGSVKEFACAKIGKSLDGGHILFATLRGRHSGCHEPCEIYMFDYLKVIEKAPFEFMMIEQFERGFQPLRLHEYGDFSIPREHLPKDPLQATRATERILLAVWNAMVNNERVDLFHLLQDARARFGDEAQNPGSGASTAKSDANVQNADRAASAAPSTLESRGMKRSSADDIEDVRDERRGEGVMASERDGRKRRRIACPSFPSLSRSSLVQQLKAMAKQRTNTPVLRPTKSGKLTIRKRLKSKGKCVMQQERVVPGPEPGSDAKINKRDAARPGHMPDSDLKTGTTRVEKGRSRQGAKRRGKGVSQPKEAAEKQFADASQPRQKKSVRDRCAQSYAS